MAFTRLVRNLTRDERFGPRVVPIIPDEARTFGMDALFREVQDLRLAGSALRAGRRATCCSPTARRKDGQILEEGITEAGAMSSFIAAGTSYATPRRAHGALLHLLFDVRVPAGRRPHLARRRRAGPRASCSAPPRVARRSSARACSTRTATASCSRPRCRPARPTTPRSRTRWRPSCKHGLRRMYGPQPEDVFYYLTLYNENYPMPPMPADVEEGIVAGLYKWADAPEGPAERATVLFSGSAQGAARAAADRARRAVGCRRRALVGDVVQGAPRGSARHRAMEPDASRRSPRGFRS